MSLNEGATEGGKDGDRENYSYVFVPGKGYVAYENKKTGEKMNVSLFDLEASR
jgi:hypothetical protein